MAKAFFATVLAGLALVLWVALPRGIKRDCPVCLGKGLLPAGRSIFVGRQDQWVERKELLCPFCRAGRLTLHDLRERRDKMLHWMVHEQKLPPSELVKRVEAAWGRSGLDELHRTEFYLQQNPPLTGGKR